MSFVASPSLNFFRLRNGAVECDEEGLRIAGADLLEKRVVGTRTFWRVGPLSVVENSLMHAYGQKIDAGRKLGALRAVANALEAGDVALAQVAALMLRLPDPPSPLLQASKANALDTALHENGWLLKTWEPDQHPRAGVAPNPGWFATTGGDNTSPKPPDVRVAQAEGGVGLPPEREDPAVVRKKIANIAKSFVNSQKWADSTNYSLIFHGQIKYIFSEGTNKCFLFVRDVLADAGVDLGLPNSLHFIGRPPFAGQWGDPNYVIPGWKVLGAGEAPEPGDVVAQRLGYGDASGHVMIVGDGRTFIGTGDPPAREEGTIEQIPAIDFLGPPERRGDVGFQRGSIIYRRWVGQ